eukprot:g2061.t1
MRHIQRLQRDLDLKSERVVREVARSGLLEQQLVQAKEQLGAVQQELDFLRGDREKARGEIRQLKKNIAAEVCEDEDTARVMAKQNDVIMGLRATIDDLETKNQKDIETIRTLRKDMDKNVTAMRLEWAATLQMVENKQLLQAKTIESLEGALRAEKRENRAMAEKTEIALAESARRKASCRDQIDTLRALRDLCAKKDRDLDQQKLRAKDAEAARRATEENLRRLQEDTCEIATPGAGERTIRNGELERQLRRSERKIRELKLSLKKQTRRVARLRGAGTATSFCSDMDEGLAAAIARGGDDAEAEDHEGVNAEDKFASSFSKALRKLTNEARREQRKMAEMDITPLSRRHRRRRKTSPSATKSKLRGRRSRRGEAERRLSSEIAMYFDDSTLEDAFF